ncbi:hypothetical protein METHPM2_50030 [Pseudomonas sp. PM2]
MQEKTMIAVEVVSNVTGFKAVVLHDLSRQCCNKTNGQQINRKTWPKSRFRCRSQP